MSRARVKRKHQGVHFNRTKDDLHVAEKIFAEAWNDLNLTTRTRPDEDCLAYLLDPTGIPNPPLKLSERDYQVAATVIQWLGSTIGEAWLRCRLETISDEGKKSKSKPRGT